MLVIINRFTKWPEPFPRAREDVKTMVKILCKEIIPRFGITNMIESENGTDFTSKVSQ